MLIKRAVLERIRSGEIDLQFRRWRRPTVKAGGALRTSVGILAIDTVEPVALRAITPVDARRAGYPSRAALIRDLASRPDGSVYRIGLRHAGADPRIAQRDDDDLSDDDIAELADRLARLDRAGRRQPWTRRFLRLLADHPHVRAEDLADHVGLDKPTFKADVRKLKELGLTISHSPGYELSPRGRAYLRLVDE